MPVTDETEERFVTLLSYIYGAINWRDIRTSKNAWDIWNHRVRAAATRPTLGEFVSRLANQFGLQSLPPEAIALTGELAAQVAPLLDLAYREHIVIAMRAVMAAKARKETRAKREERTTW